MPRRILPFLSIGLLALSACGRGLSPAYTTQTTLGRQTTPAPTQYDTPTLSVEPPAPIVITGAGFDLHTSGTVGTAAFNAAWAGVLDTLNAYLEAGVLKPLRTGGPADDLRPFFFGPAAERVVPGGPDRFAFIDENLPPVSDIRQEAAVAKLTALAGPDGVMSVVAADLDLRLIGHIAGSPVTVERTGELVLMPEGGRWRIDAYDIKVTRTMADDETTTTVHA